MFKSNLSGIKSIQSATFSNLLIPPDQINSANIAGNIRYNKSSKKYEYYDGTVWNIFDTSTGTNLWEINSSTYTQPIASITSGIKIDNVTSQSTNKIKLNDTIELKTSDYPLVNIYVDSNYTGTVENGTRLNPFKLLQSGINALPINQTGTATYTRYMINVASGNYDEDISIPANRFCNIILMKAFGPVFLGIPSGSGQYFNTATTNRNFTIYYDTSAWISTNFVRPTLSLLSDKTEDSMTTHAFYAGSGWRISGNILIDTAAPTAYRSCDFHFENVFVSGNIGLSGTGILTGGINVYMFGCKFNGTYNIPFTGTPSATNYNIFKCEKCSFSGALTVKTLAKAIDSYFASGISISINTDAIEPYNIIYGCKILGTFSSVSSSLYYCDISTKNLSTSATLTNVTLNSDIRADNIYESVSGNGTTVNNYLYLNNLSAINNNDSMSYYTMGTGKHIFYINNSANLPSANFYNQSLSANNENYITLGKTDALAGFLGYNLNSTSPYFEIGLYGLYSAFRCNDLNIIEIAPGSPIGAVLYVECPMYIDTINEYTASNGIVFNNKIKVDNIYENTASNGVIINNNLKVDIINEKTTNSGVSISPALNVDKVYELNSGQGIKLSNITHIKSTATNANLLDVYNSFLASGETIGISLGKAASSNNSVYLNFKQDSTTSIGSLGMYGFDMIQFDNSKNLNFPYGFRASGLYKNTGSWISSVIGPDLTNDVIVLGNYTTGNNAIIGAHTAALSAWRPLYINSYNTTSGNDIILGSTSSVAYFNSLISLPNYANYSASSYEGTIAYDSTTHEIKFYNGTAWKSITGYALGNASKDINIQRLFTDEIYPKNPLSKNVKISAAKIENLTLGDSKDEKHALGIDEIGFFYNADNTKYYLANNKCNNKYKMHNETYEYLQSRFKKLMEIIEKLEKKIENLEKKKDCNDDNELNEKLNNSLFGSTLNLVK